ncbi:TolC family protein [Verrucomicrobiota bacterium sgz303538]
MGNKVELEHQLADQRNRFEAGTVPRFNVLQAEVALANARPDLIRARNNYLVAELTLGRTIGVETAAQPGRLPFEPAGELQIRPQPFDLATALNVARERRSFLKVQRLQILIDAQQINVALAGYKPRLDVNGGYELRNSHLSDDLTDTVNGWFFGITGSWNIFDGFETHGRVKQARAQLEQAKVTYDDSVKQVELEVQTAFSQLQQARETVESQRKTVEQALEAVRLAQERLNAGAGTQLDLLNVQVALTRSRSTELQAFRDYEVALADLERATELDTKYDDSFKEPLARKTVVKPVTAPRKKTR